MRKLLISFLSLSLISAMTFGLFMKTTNVDTKPDSKSISIINWPDEDDNDNTGW